MLNSASNLSKDEKKKIIEFMNKEGYDVNPVDFKGDGNIMRRGLECQKKVQKIFC